jgi:hypothetical protein
MVGEPDATMQPAPQDNQLMPKHRVLSLKPQLPLEWRGQDGHNETEQPNHSASLGDSITSSTRIRFSVHTGQTYGPQDDPLGDATPGERLQLVLQFGGASGLGMSAGRARGPASGREGEPREHRLFPRPRYSNVIILNPQRFNWLPVPQASGVARKYFGSFTERAFWIEMIKINAEADWFSISTSDSARRLMVVLSGTARVKGIEIGRLSAMDVDAGERLRVRAREEMVLFVVGLPPVRLPSTPSDQFDVVESDGAIQFETPQHAA